MFIILGFYKFKKLKSLKKNKLILQKLFIDNNIKGILIISNEGLNGTISGKYKNIFLTSKKIKSLFGIVNFDSENLSKSKFQPFHKPKVKIKKEVVPMGLNISARNKKANYVDPLKWNNLIKDKDTYLKVPFEGPKGKGSLYFHVNCDDGNFFSKGCILQRAECEVRETSAMSEDQYVAKRLLIYDIKKHGPVDQNI